MNRVLTFDITYTETDAIREIRRAVRTIDQWDLEELVKGNRYRELAVANRAIQRWRAS